MSSISSVSQTSNPYQAAYQGGFAQAINDFKSIGGALQSGDLSTAQSALAAFQQDLQSAPAASQNSADQPFGANTQANTDFQTLTTALKSGDLSGAQKAFASLKTDLKPAHKGHHHHHAGAAADPTATPTAQTDSTLDNGGGGGLNVVA